MHHWKEDDISDDNDNDKDTHKDKYKYKDKERRTFARRKGSCIKA